MNHESARHGTAPMGHFAADIALDGQPATTAEGVAAALRGIFPGLEIAASDIEHDGGSWLVPVPSGIAAIVLDENADFEWSGPIDGPAVASVFIPAP